MQKYFYLSREKTLTFSNPKHYVCNKMCNALCKHILITVVTLDKHSTKEGGKERRRKEVRVNSPASED